MNGNLITAAARILPPLAFDALKWTVGTRFGGRYPSWQSAMSHCDGYDSAPILARVLESTRAVVAGHAAAERDSVRLDRIEYSWPALASLLWVACQESGHLRVVDFGGALGSSYRTHAKFWQGLAEVRWGVVEQANFVRAGKAEFEGGGLQFFDDIAQAFDAVEPNVVLLSSVLQYLEEPHALLDHLLGLQPRYVVLDRTPFIDEPVDRLTVQRVSKRIYPARYPAWFFARERFWQHFAPDYELIETFEAMDRTNIPSKYLGALFKRNAPRAP